MWAGAIRAATGWAIYRAACHDPCPDTVILIAGMLGEGCHGTAWEYDPAWSGKLCEYIYLF